MGRQWKLAVAVVMAVGNSKWLVVGEMPVTPTVWLPLEVLHPSRGLVYLKYLL